ncbi:MAG TPA: carbohydrate-binding protein [Firmicutes bacterium]|nr:carbohydrate-binding protein [Bacillota bacterium]
MVLEFLRRKREQTAAKTQAAPEAAVEFGEPELGGTQKIEVTPVPVTAGETITVKYRGELSDSGKPLMMHLGYGYGDWTNIQNVPMERMPDGSWGAQVTVDTDSALNFCFTDGERWDNNNGVNWVYEVHNGFRI